MHQMLTSEPICVTNAFGDLIYVPPFWAKFILKDCNSSIKDEKELSARLDSISIDYLAYAHTNRVGRSASTCSDPLCGNQHSLWDAPNPLDGSYDTSATINILPAWDVSTARTVTNFLARISLWHGTPQIFFGTARYDTNFPTRMYLWYGPARYIAEFRHI